MGVVMAATLTLLEHQSMTAMSFEKDRSGVYNDVQHSDLVMSSGPFLKL